MDKEWFYIIHQGEFEVMNSGSQLLVYAAIKSYCANGKREYGISIRNIAGRAKVSKSEVARTIPELVDLGLMEIVGKNNVRGGKVDVYKVSSPGTVKRVKSPSQGQLKKESVPPRSESVPTLGTKGTSIKVKSNKEAHKNNLLKVNTTGNAEKNTKAGLFKEPTPGFGGLHWSEFADRLSDYHFSKEVSKK